ncbi:MAG: hypothetical protein ACOYMG_24820, partial [Candidatus Methylumidiphilus sp.]
RPLSALIDQGLAVGMLAMWTGFDGTIYDLPSGKYRHAGRLPFYVLAIGHPAVVAHWWQWIQKDLVGTPNKDYHYVLFRRGAASSAIAAEPGSVGDELRGVRSANLINANLGQSSLVQFEVKSSALAGDFPGIGLSWFDQRGISPILPAVPRFKATPKAWQFSPGSSDCTQGWRSVEPAELGSKIGEATATDGSSRRGLEARVLSGGLPGGIQPKAVYFVSYALSPAGFAKAPMEDDFLKRNALDEQNEQAERKLGPPDFPTLNLGAVYHDLWRAAYDPPDGRNAPQPPSTRASQAFLSFRVK